MRSGKIVAEYEGLEIHEKLLQAKMKYKQVVQIIATDPDSRYFEKNIVNNDWHGVLSYSGPRTICGIQLDGEDGYGPSEPVTNVRISCPHCATIVKEILASASPQKDERIGQ